MNYRREQEVFQRDLTSRLVNMPEAEPEFPRGQADQDALWAFVNSRGMDRRQFLRLMIAGGVTAVLFACTGGGDAGMVEWDYPAPGAPENWGDLSKEFRTCATGAGQSPVNLTGYISADSTIAFHYAGAAVTARNNGHTVYLDYAEGNSMVIDGRRYELHGIHYHAPGEHLLDGQDFAAELHLVHDDTNGDLAVVGLLFRIGKVSPLIQSLLDVAPEVGRSVSLSNGPSAAEYVPGRLEFYFYDGSLTTPPCTEGVRWIVMQQIDTVSEGQVRELQKLSAGPNNRPVQSLGERRVFASGSANR